MPAIRLPLPGLVLLAGALVPGRPLGAHAVEWIASAALVVILLNGGMDIGWTRMRGSLRPVLSLGVLGTFLTAGGLAVVAHVALGLDWKLAAVAGAALAPTDPAVVFAVLGGTEIRGRAGTILEGEAGFNDPAGIALMLGMVELATHAHATLLDVAALFALQMGVGAAFGFLGARLLRLARGHPLLELAGAGALYGVTALAHGSGFLAVFVAGLVLGDEGESGHERLAGGCEVVAFAALGLTVELSGLPWGDGAILAACMALAIRPLVVLATLARARLQPGDRVFIAWSGLKGAVPILLAAFAVTGGVRDADEVYGSVFVAVLLSVFVQGSLVGAVARRVLRP
jgi:cell volume regulation protein A